MKVGYSETPRKVSRTILEANLDAIEVLRASLSDAHWLLDQSVTDLSASNLHWSPPGTTNTIAATYAHAVGTEDILVQATLRGQRPLAQTEWAGRNGISLPIPQRGSEWFTWSRRVQIDLPAVQRYAAAVYAATDEFLATLTPAQLDVPPSVALPANQPMRWLIDNLVILHAGVHSGEIAVLRGLQGLVGLP